MKKSLCNQEDSLLMNNSAIDKGLMRAQALKKYSATITKNPASSQTGIFMKPDRNKVDNLKDANYEKLTDAGFAKVETPIKDGDVIIGLVNPKPTSKENEKPYKDNSTIYKSLVPGAVDKVITGFNNDGYPIIKMRVRSERIPAVGDKFSCYDSKTEILTDKGWIFFKDLTKKHKVATLIDGKKLIYENPEAVQCYQYQGKMYQIKSNQVDLCVTPNHKMWVAPRGTTTSMKNYKLERADEIIGKRRFYQKNVDEYQDEFVRNNLFTLPSYNNKSEIKLDMHSWLIFFGIWIAEGCIKDNWAITFATHKPRVKKELKLVCDLLNFDIIYASDRKGDKEKGIYNIWHIPNKQLINFMKPYNVGAVNKYLPEWVWSLSKEQARWLINGMMLGDGHWMKNGTMRYDTSSKQLANDFQRLCLHAGWSSNIMIKNKKGYTTYIKGRKAVCTTDAYRLTIITKQNNPKVNKNKQQDEWINYNGNVFCCTVSSGVIYVRRNGIPVFSGNSRSGSLLSLSQCKHIG